MNGLKRDTREKGSVRGITALTQEDQTLALEVKSPTALIAVVLDMIQALIAAATVEDDTKEGTMTKGVVTDVAGATAAAVAAIVVNVERTMCETTRIGPTTKIGKAIGIGQIIEMDKTIEIAVTTGIIATTGTGEEVVKAIAEATTSQSRTNLEPKAVKATARVSPT